MLRAIESAETMAFLRAVVTEETRLAVSCEDDFARLFLGRKHRLLAAPGLSRCLPRRMVHALVEAAAPGSYAFTITRTRHFDEALLRETRRGIGQLVLLGAGYDSRPWRFRSSLAGVSIFELDHPATQGRKRAILKRAGKASPPNVSYLAVDFSKRSLREVLIESGFAMEKRTLFLWEGVSYYLPQPVVENVLDFVGKCGPGSSILFDYATRRFVNGDTSTYGGKHVARWLRKIGEPFLFGLDAGEAAEFLYRRSLQLFSDLGAEELEQSYLKTKDGGCLGKSLGHVRMAHASTVS